jgi:hypothetical protein
MPTTLRIGRTSVETRCYLLSRAFTPERLNAIVRSHWGIENGLHWVLDVIIDEDQARNRKDHGPQNLGPKTGVADQRLVALGGLPLERPRSKRGRRHPSPPPHRVIERY